MYLKILISDNESNIVSISVSWTEILHSWIPLIASIKGIPESSAINKPETISVILSISKSFAFKKQAILIGPNP